MSLKEFQDNLITQYFELVYYHPDDRDIEAKIDMFLNPRRETTYCVECDPEGRVFHCRATAERALYELLEEKVCHSQKSN